jgi:hypothetical protein
MFFKLWQSFVQQNETVLAMILKRHLWIIPIVFHQNLLDLRQKITMEIGESYDINVSSY